jgi:signal transduction histidine kinase
VKRLRRSGTETPIDAQPSDFPRLAQDLETAVFRIIQEALTNVFRHAEARTATVSLVRANGRVSVAVCDDGEGMADQTLKFRPGTMGIGLGGMRQRVKRIRRRVATAKCRSRHAP